MSAGPMTFCHAAGGSHLPVRSCGEGIPLSEPTECLSEAEDACCEDTENNCPRELIEAEARKLLRHCPPGIRRRPVTMVSA